MQTFNIIRIFRNSLSSVQIDVTMEVREYQIAKKRGMLGHLFGVGISNEVYRVFGVKAYMPTVEHSHRAVKGIKTITLWYQDTVWTDRPSCVIRFPQAA